MYSLSACAGPVPLGAFPALSTQAVICSSVIKPWTHSAPAARVGLPGLASDLEVNAHKPGEPLEFLL